MVYFYVWIAQEFIINMIHKLQIYLLYEDLVFLTKGGNHKFKIFLAEYNIIDESPFELKYFSKASNYY